MTRWKAASIHLLISFGVLATVAGILLWRWFPPALLELARADHLLLVLAAVDLTLGPLLTLVVYKAGKPSLRFDLTVIALMQVAALLYGLGVFWQGRPVYLVGVVDRFELVVARDLDAQDLAEARPPFDRLPLGGLQTVGAMIPDDPVRRSDLLSQALEGGKDVAELPQHYVPYQAVSSAMRQRARPAQALLAELPADQRATLERGIGWSGKRIDELAVLPITSSRSTAAATMLIDAVSGTPLGPVAVDPFPAAAQGPRAGGSYPQPN